MQSFSFRTLLSIGITMVVPLAAFAESVKVHTSTKIESHESVHNGNRRTEQSITVETNDGTETRRSVRTLSSGSTGSSSSTSARQLRTQDATTVLNAKTGTAFDAAFLDAMTAHHQGAVRMAVLASRRAENPELKSMAKTMAATQKAEIRQMRDWRRDWNLGQLFQRWEIVSGMNRENRLMMRTLMNKRGAAFDDTFIDLMIMHHQSGIEMATSALTKAVHQEIKDLAKKISETQQKEIEQMEKMK